MRRDAAHVHDMLRYAEEAQAFVGDLTASELESSTVALRAVTWCVATVGEAAARLSPVTRASIADIPWAALKGMRNVLVHQYDRIRVEVLRDTVVYDFPPMIATLRAWLAAHDAAHPEDRA